MNEEIVEDLDEEILLNFPPYEVEELSKEDVLSDLVMNYLASLKFSPEKIRLVEEVRQKAREYKMTNVFNKIYKMKEKELGIEMLNRYNSITFPDFNDIAYDSNKYKLDKEGIIWEMNPNAERKLVCYHPILPVTNYENVEDSSEKIKLAFYKYNKWRYITVDKSSISSTQAIVKLSDLGISVNSENARLLIKYLAEMEYLNKDKIETIPSISRLGWYKDEFIPYSKQYYYVGNATYKNIYDSIKHKGDYTIYCEKMKELRKSSLVLRFMMAASCASPLIELLNINTFIVHLWGKSEIGKTLMLMVCASIWGNPKKGKLLTTLNSTEVAFETLNNLLNNLPLFIDELQTICNEKTNIDDLIYKLTEGKGRDRGNKDGGLRENTKWNNIIFLTGEQPITSNNSKEGVKNRVIEIEENKKIVADGNSVANLIFDNYGFVGEKFIEIIKNKNNIKEEFNNLKSKLSDYCKYSKQIEAVATILLADKILSEEIFCDNAIEIEETKRFFRKDTDEAERYIELILDIANAHINNFFDKDKKDDEFPKIELWGKVDKNDKGEIEFYYFIPNILSDILKKYNINIEGIKEKLSSKEFLIRSKNAYTVNTKIRNNQHRMYKIKNIYLNEKDT